MTGVLLLLLVTCLYAGYNLLVKQSATIAESTAASTITATIALQAVALFCSLVFYICLRVIGGENQFALPTSAYVWAGLAGLCIGLAEIGYFYLFRGSSLSAALPVSVATPAIVGGTVVIAMVAAMLFFSETIGPRQWLGAIFIIAGLLLVTQ